MEETALDRETCSAGDFEKAENALPKQIGSRSNIPLMDNISSYLGASNPLAKKVNPNVEEVWLLDNTAYRPVHIYPHRSQPYQAHFVAAYFKKNTGKDWSKAVANIADLIGINKQGDDRAETEKTIAHRLLPFVQTIAPARSVDVNFPDGNIHKLGPGGRSAVSDQTMVFSGKHEDGESVSIPAVPADVTPHGPMLTHFAAPEGWLVVSGTDIKLSNQTCLRAEKPDRYRRLHQNHNDTRPNRHPPHYIRFRACTHRWNARALCRDC